MMRKIAYCLILYGFLAIVPSFAQDCDPMDPDGCGGNPDEIPLDGGVGLLIGAGVLYGLKKLKNKSDEQNLS